jgi:NADPH:quinone reductase-like Zn-dependent oxidoreductase
VLTQGTGGVSVFAVQFAKAAGAKVIATTSSSAKADVLKKLGADYVLNYQETANWGEEAKRISGSGVDFVIEVGGPTTFGQSLKAVKIGGTVAIIGFVGGATEGPGCMEILGNLCTFFFFFPLFLLLLILVGRVVSANENQARYGVSSSAAEICSRT